MGLLDDAIREHLELKRKHGAPDEELSRQETEALGPARRDFASAETAVEPEPVAPVPSDEAAADYEPAAPPAEPAEPAGWLDEELETESAPPPRVSESPTPVPPLEPVQPDPVPPVPAEPTTAAAEPPPRRTSDTPTQGFDALSLDEEDEPEAAPEGEDSEDVLEETPDFLQDTPEHDRLWFEQKPPRDFDFDD
jgi:hypothetical protein